MPSTIIAPTSLAMVIQPPAQLALVVVPPQPVATAISVGQGPAGPAGPTYSGDELPDFTLVFDNHLV